MIIDDLARDLCLCRLHKAVAVKKLEEFHALLRAERARFNAGQAEKVAQMDGGGLFQIVDEQHRTAERNLRTANVTPMPRLPAAREEEPSVTLVTASGPDRDEDDD